MTITKVEVERLVKSDKRFKTMCPRCNGILNEYPALSRHADVYICSDCGTEEAMEDYFSGNPLREINFNTWLLGRDKRKVG